MNDVLQERRQMMQKLYKSQEPEHDLPNSHKVEKKKKSRFKKIIPRPLRKSFVEGGKFLPTPSHEPPSMTLRDKIKEELRKDITLFEAIKEESQTKPEAESFMVRNFFKHDPNRDREFFTDKNPSFNTAKDFDHNFFGDKQELDLLGDGNKKKTRLI